MLRGPLSLCLLSLGVLAACQGPLIPQGAGIAESGIAEPAVVSIYTWQPRGLTGSRAQGTGFLVSQDEVVTNLHVIEGATAAAVRFADGHDRVVESVIGEDMDADLVLLRLRPGAEENTALVLHEGDTPVGMPIRIVGSPDGVAQTRITGRVASRVLTFDVLDEAVMLSATVAPGMSGSPVLTDSGAVAGIVSRGTNVEGQSYMVPSRRLRQLARFDPMTLASWSQWKGRQPSHAGRLSFGAAAVAFEGGSYEESIALLRSAIGQGLPPAGHATAWYVIGDAHTNLGRDLEAIDAYQRAIALRPRHALSHGALALALRRQERYPEAIQAYDRALELMPTMARFHVGRGWTLLRMQGAPQAEAAFRLGVRLDPESVAGWTGLATARLAQGDAAGARDHATRATRLAPQVEKTWWVLAAAQQRLGAWRAAADAWSAGLRIKPDEAKARFELARAHLALGETDAARRQLAELQRLGSPLAVDLDRLLRGS
ncbi:MAG: tetratricopeptide repeat-containing serine protease family protein [Planctomycetota bacterium]|nr:tetratricopeptide repeat-containing serine protease family protein [Planctomycetota bacterium]